jgi:Flp pilus assembly protein protease CpaA
VLSHSESGFAVIQWGVVIGASLVAAFFDLRARLIPNALTLPLLASGLIWALLDGGPGALGEAAGASLLLGVPYVLLFVFAGGGAGDAKLMAGVGAWLGFPRAVAALCFVAAAGMIMAVAKAAARGRLREVITEVLLWFYSLLHFTAGRSGTRPEKIEADASSAGGTIPYGIAICAGLCLAAGYEYIW